MYKLYETQDTTVVDKNAPLADRMRPKSLREFLGQSEIAGDGSLLRRAITMDRLGSCIFTDHRVRAKLRLLILLLIPQAVISLN